ncbi:cysteine desulfurase [Boothiomyces macroporosus]|uniref:Cysteine desulfurase, mitosomal n=1 Tax=Boothiomyces macroporosus TaxID=261099 RepID=A0AAD5UM20_9FUNG|nr:cysteine desulfurase [Boothiomyces macroporosus]
MRSVLSNSEVGAIIGSKSEFLKEIKKNSGFSLKFSTRVKSTPDRVMTLSGSLDQLETTISMITNKLTSKSNSNSWTFRILVPNQKFDEIIGDGSVNIKELAANTGAKIYPHRDLQPFSTERVIGVQGDALQLGSVWRHIAQIIGTYHLENSNDPTIFYIPGYSSSDPLPPLFEIDSASSDPLQAVTQEFKIPARFAGKLIGRNGDNIKEINSLSGSKVFISNDLENGERKVIMTGTKSSNIRAAQLIQSHLDMLSLAEANQIKSSTLRPIYLDAQATTPMDPRVLDKMLPYFTNQFGNPHSRTHQYGWESEHAVEDARQKVADLIHADPKEVIFTSGATESNNTAIKGVANFYKSRKNHIITTQTEHKCVLESCRMLQEDGFKVTYLPVNSNGLINLEDLKSAITGETSIVSIMAVNNEIGVIQPLKEIGEICRERKVFFHTDAAQAIGKIKIDVEAMKIDLMSISGHKLYGPKGVGALYVRRRPRVRLEPLISGGGQERGLRSGTVPTPLVVGLGEAARVAKQEMQYDSERITKLSHHLIESITSQVPNVVRNGDPEHHYPGCVNLSFQYVEGESLLMALKDIALSSGSACTSASLEPSYVLRALGADDETAHSSIRFGIGRFTTEEEIEFTIKKVVQHVERLREMSPLWEMVIHF